MPRKSCPSLCSLCFGFPPVKQALLLPTFPSGALTSPHLLGTSLLSKMFHYSVTLNSRCFSMLTCLIGNFVYNAATSHLPEHFPLTQMIGLYSNQPSSLLLCHIFARRLYIARMVNWEQREKNISTKQMKIPSVLKSILY